MNISIHAFIAIATISVVIISATPSGAQSPYRHVGVNETGQNQPGHSYATTFDVTFNQWPSRGCSKRQHVYARSGLSSSRAGGAPHYYLEGGLYGRPPKRGKRWSFWPLIGSHKFPAGRAVLYDDQGIRTAIPLGVPVTVTTEKIENEERGLVTWSWTDPKIGARFVSTEVSLPGWVEDNLGRANVWHEVFASNARCWNDVDASFDNIEFFGGTRSFEWREFPEYLLVKSADFSGFDVTRGLISLPPAPSPVPVPDPDIITPEPGPAPAPAPAPDTCKKRKKNGKCKDKRER